MTERTDQSEGRVEAAARSLCRVTGNPVGTDTWAVGHPCKCENCQRYLLDLVDRLRAEREETRGALREIRDYEVPVGVGAEVANWLKRIARRALEGTDE